MVTIDSTLDDIMKLDYASREMVLEILQKRQIETRRDEMTASAEQSIADYKNGETLSMTIDEVITKLNSY